MVSEVDFATAYLTSLSPKPLTIPADHVEDPRTIPARSLFTLPKLPTPMKPLQSEGTTTTPQTATVILKSLRPPQIINESLPLTPLSTTLSSLKAIVSEKTGGTPIDRIRLMLKGKILGDAKSVGEIVEEGGEVVVSVMITGGVGGGASTPSATADVVGAGESGDSMEVDKSEGGDSLKVLESENFWENLDVFLRQKLGDNETAKTVGETFRSAWRDR